ncbi:universal stress protein UspA-like protein [Halovivax ruber XH-70]|uniref:Universal stress protein UspA-like protein n=1 Tax=Halovivax ruber (strain DSM 18193 / JCM 13892 / XH-70) TaxID=797302 RepID=L0I722_HALRX|nr:universal stress protein [Halovivax ruber]AGB15340.1 universal stress protein UspA-like protein [Halovivax ruber XH-70]
MARFIERVLLPTDGSDGALSGARRGIALASQTAASVSVLSVVDAPVVGDDAAIASLESRAEEAVETVANMARDYDDGIDVTTAVERGTPFQAVREYAHRHEIDVIAMGTKGRTGLDRFLLGSVTENVLRTARVPVLAVPPDADEPGIADVAFDRLLLPTDGSEGAEIAAEWGVALADHLGSDVHSLYAVDPAPPHHEPDAVIEALERRAEAAIEATSERADAVDVAVTESIETGSPANAILAYASDHEVDLIVMGTHGRTGVGQWFLGSVTENVVRGADVPVLCVPVTAPSP